MLGRRLRIALSVGIVSVALGTTVGEAIAPTTSAASATDSGERGPSWSLADSPERVVIISDSAIAGIRWTGNVSRLVNANWDDRLESCRRLVRSSCRGREGYRPLTAQLELQYLVGQHGLAGPDDVLVMAVGYNDWHGTFTSDFQTVMTQARHAGFRHVAWMTYRENNTYTLPGDHEHRVSNYAVMNQVLRTEQASGRWPELTLFEYDAATRGISGWHTSDGIHLTAAGGRGVADWLSTQILYVHNPGLAPDNWLPPSER